MTETPITLRIPTKEDGSDVWSLVQECKPLDENSMYCNVLQCDHFADTCVLAEMDGELAGWISGYILPDDPETLFVWQVAVSPIARGRGLGRKMLAELISRDVCDGVTRLQTTITKENDASWGLFNSFADRAGGDLNSKAHFKADAHFNGTAKTEHLVTITLAEEFRAAA